MPKGFTKEEHRLMNVHKKATTPTGFYIGVAAVVSIAPVLLFSRIMVMDLVSNVLLFAVFAAVATAALTFAYQNTARKSKDDFAQKRREAVRAVVEAEVKESKSGKKSKDDLDTLVVERQSQVSENEAKLYSISFVNACKSSAYFDDGSACYAGLSFLTNVDHSIQRF
eukprot:TRINITY_DN7238_c0_g1_i2.p1 TRINITY_DN7238_c0_g1~~TRINITY_DN7238_c0_g1_i2.p1  ORF type:complete len:168 (+),score=31.81 TRINITY_DN7238_c0_g1_i2:158-661(+)